jgi:hypothetical protein
MIEIVNQDTLIMNNLTKFFQQANHYDKFVSIINKQNANGISLRIIDWFVTKYTKQNNLCYNLHGKPFYVHQAYKNKLKGLNKHKFDSCRRKYTKGNTFMFKEVETTIGQMNFFKWAIDNGVIDYIEKNYQKLHMALNKPVAKQCHEQGITHIAVKFN